MSVGNDGTDFQTGCGYDPYDTGCCVPYPNNVIQCYVCPAGRRTVSNDSFVCSGDLTVLSGFTSERDKFTDFYDGNGNIKICGSYHSPR